MRTHAYSNTTKVILKILRVIEGEIMQCDCPMNQWLRFVSGFKRHLKFLKEQ